MADSISVCERGQVTCGCCGGSERAGVGSWIACEDGTSCSNELQWPANYSRNKGIFLCSPARRHSRCISSLGLAERLRRYNLYHVRSCDPLTSLGQKDAGILRELRYK